MWSNSRLGYFMIDHRASPGVAPEQARAMPGAIPVQEGQLFEANAQKCGHCDTVSVLNPLRQRDRGYCRKCDHYVCDRCEVVRVASGYECRAVSKVVDEFLERQLRGNYLFSRDLTHV